MDGAVDLKTNIGPHDLSPEVVSTIDSMHEAQHMIHLLAARNRYLDSFLEQAWVKQHRITGLIMQWKQGNLPVEMLGTGFTDFLHGYNPRDTGNRTPENNSYIE
jgi:hypothetical protein